MIDKRNVSKGILSVLTLILLTQPAQADERDGERGHRGRHHYPSYHKGYHNHHNHQYCQHHHRYHSCDYRPRHHYPEYGKAVLVLPGGFVKVVIGGHRYYYCDGVYYRHASYGYEVVSPPRSSRREDSKFERNDDNDDREEITINVSNYRGPDTNVILKRSGDGYIGPQGEFYLDFPKMSELRDRYAK